MRKRLQINDGSNSETSAPVQSTELIINSNYGKKTLTFIESAKQDIRICAYAWRWYLNNPEYDIQKFNVAILRARDRGVRVRVICDNSVTHSMLKNEGIHCKFVESNRIMHIKAVMVDLDTLVLGSHNLTKNAYQNNMEASVIIKELEPLLQFQKYFDGVWDTLNGS